MSQSNGIRLLCQWRYTFKVLKQNYFQLISLTKCQGKMKTFQTCTGSNFCLPHSLSKEFTRGQNLRKPRGVFNFLRGKMRAKTRTLVLKRLMTEHNVLTGAPEDRSQLLLPLPRLEKLHLELLLTVGFMEGFNWRKSSAALNHLVISTLDNLRSPPDSNTPQICEDSQVWSNNTTCWNIQPQSSLSAN